MSRTQQIYCWVDIDRHPSRLLDLALRLSTSFKFKLRSFLTISYTVSTSFSAKLLLEKAAIDNSQLLDRK